MMTDERFAEIKLLRAQGTAGPWKAEPVGLFKSEWNVVGAGWVVAQCFTQGETRKPGAAISIVQADALAICALDELIAEVERLRGEVARLEETPDHMDI